MMSCLPKNIIKRIYAYFCLPCNASYVLAILCLKTILTKFYMIKHSPVSSATTSQLTTTHVHFTSVDNVTYREI